MTQTIKQIAKLSNPLYSGVVEFKELGEILDFEQPTKYIVKSVKYDDNFKIPVLTAGQTFIKGYTNEDFGIFKANKENPVIIFDDFTTSFHWVDFNFKVKSSAMKILTPKKDLNNNFRFIYFIMKCIKYKPKNHGRSWISKYSKIKIPIPPLSVQEEIVKILDNFTSLEVELKEELKVELEARIKQYEYYKNELFSFNDKINWLPLKDVAEIGTGSSNTNEGLIEGLYPFFVRSQIVRYKNNFEFDETAIITSGDGVGVGKIFHYVEGKYALHQRAYRIRVINNIIIPKFLFYYMKNAFERYILGSAFRSSVTSVRRPMLNKFPVPILSISEQEHIVKIIEKYDALVNDISIRLPAELNARRKQYEYYREKLLTFKEKINDE